MLADARMPVSAPAAMNTGSQSNKTVRPIHSVPSTFSLSDLTRASAE
jgi:hypothetical protein